MGKLYQAGKRDMSEEQKKRLRPRCGDASCDENLHCYHRARRRSRRASKTRPSNISPGSSKAPAEMTTGDTSPKGSEGELPAGSCQQCGAQLVPWERVHRRDLNDACHTFKALKTELIRHYEFHAPIHQHARNYAQRKGRKLLRAKIADHLRTSIGPVEPFHDGWQTHYPDPENPGGLDIIYAAQHATACCCRKCVEIWHAIPQGRDLTEEEMNYLADLAMLFVDERLPGLADSPIHVPPIRRRRAASEGADETKGAT
jgi:hypothetical protein